MGGNERLRVGVVGLRRGLAHLRSLMSLDEVEVVGVCDRLDQYREQAHKVMARAKTPVLHEYEEVLALRPDAMVIATNAKRQVEHACQALEAGCHVFSEIPGAYTFEEVIQLRDCVERSGRLYMLGENRSFNYFLSHWRKWYVEGLFGAISLAEAEYLHYLPQTLFARDGTRLSPSEARGQREVQPIWRADQPPIQYLTHDLGPLLEVLDDRCVSVSCRSGPWWSPEAPLRSDGQIALFETANGSLIRILITLNSPRPQEHRYRLFGTEGGAEWSAYEGYCRRFAKGRDHREGWERIDIGTAPSQAEGKGSHGGTDIRLIKSWVDAILKGRPSPIDVYRMADYTVPGIMAVRSAELGGAPVPIPNLHRGASPSTQFWDHVGLPE